MRNPPARVAPTSVMLEDLTPKKQAFVRAYLANLEAGNVGRGSTADAVEAAGLAGNRNAARVRAFELMRDPEVLSALQNEQIRKLNAGSSLGVAVLIDLARNAKSEPVRLQAAVQLVDRSPLGPVPSRSMNVNANVTIDDFILALSDADLSGAPAVRPAPTDAAPDEPPAPWEDGTGDVIDAEFREVTPISQQWAAQAHQAQREVTPEA